MASPGPISRWFPQARGLSAQLSLSPTLWEGDQTDFQLEVSCPLGWCFVLCAASILGQRRFHGENRRACWSPGPLWAAGSGFALLAIQAILMHSAQFAEDADVPLSVQGDCSGDSGAPPLLRGVCSAPCPGHRRMVSLHAWQAEAVLVPGNEAGDPGQKMPRSSDEDPISHPATSLLSCWTQN